MKKSRIALTPEVERLTIRTKPEPTLRRPDAPREPQPLATIAVTSRLLLCIAYVDAFAKKQWNPERAYDTIRALGFKPQDIANARAVWKARQG